MASAYTWFDKHDKDDDDDEKEAHHSTPMRRSVVAGVRAVIAHLQTQRAKSTQLRRQQREAGEKTDENPNHDTDDERDDEMDF